MSTGIKIVAPPLEELSVGAAASAVAKVLEAGHEAHADQETTREALRTLSKFGAISGVSVTGCHVAL